jgi:hypothetical protein
MAKKKTISPNYLDGVPLRCDDRPWREKEDGMVEIDVENKGFYNTIAQKLFKKPRVSHISLDQYGSAVWKGVDGTNTVYDIVRLMEQEFPEEKDRMLDRVVTFMATLERNGFIRMQGGKA